MNAEKMIKEQAKYQLSGKWAIALAGAFAFVFVPSIVGLLIASAYTVIGETPVTQLFSEKPVIAVLFVLIHLAAVAVLLLLSPTITGTVRLYSMIANGDDTEASDVFYFFESKKRYREAVAFMSLLLLKVLGVIVACEAAAVAVFITAGDKSNLVFIACFLAVAGGIGAYLWLHRFTFQLMLFSYYEYEGAAAIKTGGEIASGNTGKLIKLTFTFALWLLFSVLLFPLIYVFPYITCARFTSAKYLVGAYLDSQNTEPAEETPITAQPETEDSPAAVGSADEEPADDEPTAQPAEDKPADSEATDGTEDEAASADPENEV